MSEHLATFTATRPADVTDEAEEDLWLVEAAAEAMYQFDYWLPTADTTYQILRLTETMAEVAIWGTH